MTFRILACDGGGIRGYLSSRLIQELNTATKGKFLKSVDGYAGTSTGSLISIALASGKLGIDQLVTIYKTEGPTIFQKTPYLTMDEVRAEFGADCSDMSDEELLSSGRSSLIVCVWLPFQVSELSCWWWGSVCFTLFGCLLVQGGLVFCIQHGENVDWSTILVHCDFVEQRHAVIFINQT